MSLVSLLSRNKFYNITLVLGSVMFYPVITLLTVITCFTFFPAAPPFSNITGDIKTERRNMMISVVYTRDYTIERPVDALVCRSIVHTETSSVYELGCIARELKVGKASMTRIFIVPEELPDGLYTFKTTLTWVPMFSLRMHTRAVPDMFFKICGKTELCLSDEATSTAIPKPKKAHKH